jgi:hypothetical protein
MTIPLQNYSPVEVDINADREYRFPWRWVGQDSVEVYEVYIDGFRRLVPIQDYSLTTDTAPRKPIKEAGLVKFSRPHRNDVIGVRIERNTLIVSNLDTPTFRPISIQMVEFALDKLTLIMQEMNERKCSSVVSTPITQNQLFGAYQQIRGSSIKSALDKAYQIALEIDSSAQDCLENPDLTGIDVDIPLGPNPSEPVDPPQPEDPVDPSGSTDLGDLDQLSAFRRDLFLTVPEVQSFSWQVDATSTIPVVFWDVLPQNTLPGTYRAWISATNGGPPIGPRADVEYYGRRGGGFSIATPVSGRGAENRGEVIDVDTTYYFNIVMLDGGDSPDSFTFWQIGGAF